MSVQRIVGWVLSVVLLGLAGAGGYFGYRFWREREASAVQSPAPAAPDHAAMGHATTPVPGGTAPSGGPGQAVAYAPVTITADQQQRIGVTTGRAEVRPLEKTLRAVGRVDVDETRIAHIHTKISGWVDEVFVNYTFQHVQQGDPLFTIYSPELVATQEELLLALRARDSLGASTVPGVARGTGSLLEATRRRLSLWDISPEQIAEVERTGQVRRALTIYSPITGHVTERRNVYPSTYVTPEMELYTIVDHTQVWINADIYESEIGFVQVGQRAVATTDAYPGRQFAGRVSYIWPHLMQETRTLKVRLEFPNPDLELKPEMFTNVELKIPLGRRLVVPESAVVDTGARQVVFVVQGQGSYLPRDVRTGVRVEGMVEILQGLRSGEQVVTSANFLIDSESQLRAALGSMTMGTGVTEMAGRPAAPPAAGVPAAAQARIQFRTDPAPLRASGSNLFVTLSDAAGNPIADASVRVVFFMPAMPAMGMAAMRAEAPLNASGGGAYQGPVRLPSPGAWQVTITAERGGAVLGMQQLSIAAQP